jgi:hypothetical protein
MENPWQGLSKGVLQYAPFPAAGIADIGMIHQVELHNHGH